jgi:tetratricopeptide (TPR) repeat protein
MRIVAAALTALVVSAAPSAAQSSYQLNPDTGRVMQHYRLGWEAFRIEHWDEAAKEFKQVIDIDATYKLAYYGLGRSYMGLKRFGDAAAAYEHCRALYQQDASNRFASRQEADRIRQDDLDQLKAAINTLNARSENGKPTASAQTQSRLLKDQAQRIQNKRDELNRNVDLGSDVPAFVSLALGSAYFREAKFAEAEKALKDTLDIDPKFGEAWNNLAALYLFTNRIEEADRAVTSAEKVGYTVNPDLKADIKKRRNSGGH